MYKEERELLNQIAQIKEAVNELKDIQGEQIEGVKKYTKILNIKLDKLREFNEIADMTNQLFETRITNMETRMNKLEKKVKQ